VHDKFIKLDIHAPHVIPPDFTKWHIQLIHILSAIAFLIPARIDFFVIYSCMKLG
jgi:hypothetical protein